MFQAISKLFNVSKVSLLCAQVLCYGTGLCVFVPLMGKCNAAGYKDRCVLPKPWDQFGEGEHMASVRVIWPQTYVPFSMYTF